jgi:hypothetical protein
MATSDCGSGEAEHGDGPVEAAPGGEGAASGASSLGQAPPLGVATEATGPSEEFVSRAIAVLAGHPDLVAALGGADHRVLAFNVTSLGELAPQGLGKPAWGCTPDGFSATIYDYAEDRVLQVTGSLQALDSESPDHVDIEVLGHQPLPDGGEFAAALDVVMHNRELRARIRSGAVAPFAPMPPIVTTEQPNGRVERAVTVGLRSTDVADPRHEVLAVRMFDGQVLHDLEGLVQAGTRVCEPPPGTDPFVPRGGKQGQCWVTVTSGNQTLWRFLAIRPGASSGTNGSGIELRYVDYRGKRVLYQAHVPILNVEYGADGRAIGCGPTYRDWQNAETLFEANGAAVAPGFVLCPTPARTIIDSGSDTGNFSGVAIYVEGQEVVLVSEMQAGWYRYISEWRLHANGTIRPRFGFAGTQNRCTCDLHTHHVYWRFDFDIRTPGNNVVEEYNNPAIVAGSNWHTKTFEIRRPRDPGHHRKWRVSNSLSHEAYDILPGPHDGTPTAYGVGDLWVLRYKPGEIDDGQGFTTDPNLSMAHLSNFMTPPESVLNTDVVVWYADHYVHDAGVEVGNWVGPTFVPVHW